MKKKRTFIQLLATALTNGYVLGFTKGKIYQGDLKKICVPGLNCYSCPGALGSCPIGSLQAVLGSRNYRFSFYMLGFFMLVGALLGRAVCGFLCPFGLLQDLLYKIPFFKKVKNLPGHKYLIYLKYVILVVFVILMPLIFVDIIGQGSPWFCKLICPAGTLEGGWTLALLSPEIRESIGWLFTWKSFILIGILILSMGVYRPFCKYVCPLGGIYGLFNPIAFYRISIDEEKCTKCSVCRKACPMDIPVYETPNSRECIRCGECKAACPHQAIKIGFGGGRNDK
ncbi:MAG TPA: 4Fe-4S binding protein [Lachnospiraceae bacterium]|nr:4Fe-4S binding protein [Lachnospiraceae bacterium]